MLKVSDKLFRFKILSHVRCKSDQWWQETKVIYMYVYTGHPSCLDMNTQLVAVIQTYPWQCMECKTCIICRDPFDEVVVVFKILIEE